MWHRKLRETKQQPSTLHGSAMPGNCLVSFCFLCDIHSIHSVQGIKVVMAMALPRKNDFTSRMILHPVTFANIKHILFLPKIDFISGMTLHPWTVRRTSGMHCTTYYWAIFWATIGSVLKLRRNSSSSFFFSRRLMGQLLNDIPE